MASFASPARLSLILGLGLAAAGCGGAPTPGPGPPPGPAAWIDAPRHGSIQALAPLEVVIHAADPGGILQVELSANGEPVGTVSPDDPGAPLVTVRFPWNPPHAGVYLLTARSQNHSGAWSAATSNEVSLLAPGTDTPPPPSPTPTWTPTPSLTPTPACTDVAALVADVTIPDGMRVTPGATFTKTWRLRNEGTCLWDEAYQVVFVGGDPMNNLTPRPLPAMVPAGTTVDISLTLVAPTTPGPYRGEYRLRPPGGVEFGLGPAGEIPLDVQIVSALPPTAPPPTPTPPPDTQAPTISVSHSPAGPSLPKDSIITFTATASDNVAVVRIDIWVAGPGQLLGVVKTCNNTTSCSYTGGPYSTPGTLKYSAVARDAAGNATSSGNRTITIYVVVSRVDVYPS